MTLEKGNILSEAPFYTVKDITNNPGKEVVLVDDNSGLEITVSMKYATTLLKSAHSYAKEEKITRTEMIEIFTANPNTAMTVCFLKQVKEADVCQQIYEAYPNAKGKLLSEAAYKKQIKAAIKSAIHGEERIIRGRHFGSKDEFDRMHFVDMEVAKDPTAKYDVRMRRVDPRTIQWMVVNNVKYLIK